MNVANYPIATQRKNTHRLVFWSRVGRAAAHAAFRAATSATSPAAASAAPRGQAASCTHTCSKHPRDAGRCLPFASSPKRVVAAIRATDTRSHRAASPRQGDPHETVGVLLLERLAMRLVADDLDAAAQRLARVDAQFEHIVPLDGFEPEPRVALAIEKREPNEETLRAANSCKAPAILPPGHSIVADGAVPTDGRREAVEHLQREWSTELCARGVLPISGRLELVRPQVLFIAVKVLGDRPARSTDFHKLQAQCAPIERRRLAVRVIEERAAAV